MPYANTKAMQCHLDEISRCVAQDTHAALLMDQAGWHKAIKLKIPDNITIIFIPSYSPELNPPLGDCGAITCRSVVENIWQFLRQNYLSNQVFETYEDIVEACCNAWNKLTSESERITTIAERDWATHA